MDPIKKTRVNPGAHDGSAGLASYKKPTMLLILYSQVTNR